MKRTLFLLAISSLFIFAKCTTTRIPSDKPPVVLGGVSEASALLDLVRATNLPYDWYSATGTGTIDWEDQRLSAKVTVRIRKDSVIWAQISKLGIEVGRMYVTPDSAFFINRIEQKYARYSTADFFKKFNMPADFDMFAKIFTGGAFIPPSVAKMTIENDGALFLESSSGVTARHWLDVNYQLIKSQVMDSRGQEVNAGYGNYTAVNTGQKFPFLRTNTIIIDGESNLFDLDYSTVMVNVPQEFPFSIPSHYEKM
jgi:hypothetical protein